ADHSEFKAEFGAFCRKAVTVLRDCGRSVEETEGAPSEADFLLPPDDAYPDDRVLVVVTFRGGRLTQEIVFELSQLVENHQPGYHIFIDGQVSHGRSFEIVFTPDGQVLGHEREGTDLLGALGFPSQSTNQAEQAAGGRP
ncbi:hypothetical protein, partial [Haloferula sp. A504]|uniref:hypothetical protein n=1 Tax=Haloferula sp. A504 TaxID=3373601 RepID=UPI0031C362CC|nr:hypothetical protein [Verrucomicrobiaceae bacterium E54]